MMFRIREDERVLSLLLIVCFTVINIIYIYNFYGIFWPKMSGYDPWVHAAVTDWIYAPYIHQDSYVHSLFAFLLLPLYGINVLFTHFFSFNCADFILGFVLVINSLFSFLFLKRIFSDILEISFRDSILLSILFFSFAYIMIMIVVPEHFPFSMLLLITTLYISGCKMKKKTVFSKWEIVLLYIFTAGITITNGLKVVFSFFGVNGKKALSFKNIINLFLIPLLFLFLVAFCGVQLTQNYPFSRFTLAKNYHESTLLLKPHIDKSKENFSIEDLAKFENNLKKKSNSDNYSAPNFLLNYKNFIKENSSHIGFFKVIFCNFGGESLQFHAKQMLKDRKIYGLYDNPFNYIAQMLLLIMVCYGIYLGRNDRFMKLCLSFFIFDFILHIVFGFAFQEVYIMTPHWAFFIPICIGYLFKYGNRIKLIRSVVSCLTLFLLLYNGFLFIKYCYQ